MSDMRDIILASPEQITHSLEVNKDVRVAGEFDSIVLAGMGGSGHPGDLLNALHLSKVHLHVHRSYGLPVVHTQKPLFIASSYSGNTEETISAYQAAKKTGWGLMVNTAGGKLAEFAKADKAPLVTIDYPGMQPRHTLFASFTGLTTALTNCNLTRDITNDLKAVAETLHDSIPSLEEPAKELAKKLKNKVPIFTSGHALAFAAKNFKIQANENAKTPASWNEFPELNHNEMIGFSNPTADYSGKFHVVMLRDEQDDFRINARLTVTADLYKKWGVEVSIIEITGETFLAKLFQAITFGLWTTYYLALEYNIDPVPVDGVEDFKKRLGLIPSPEISS